MGAAGDERQGRQDTRRAKQKEQRARRRNAGGTADYEGVDWRPIVALTAALAKAGGAVRLGYTRDGGAYALGLYMGDDYATEYIRPSEDWETAIGEIADLWTPDGGESYRETLASLAT